MPRRGENIRKRKDGRWEARYSKGKDNQGKCIYASVYAASYREVKEKRNALLNNVNLQEHMCSPKFADVLEQWVEANRFQQKESTVYRYRYLIRMHIAPVLGALPVHEITASAINAFLSEKLEKGRLDGKGGLSAAYVRSIMLIICGALDFALSKEWCQPLKKTIYKPQEKSKEVPILSVSQQRRLEQILLTDTDSTKLGVYISLYTGLRIGEICALRWDDIDIQSGILHVRHTVVRIQQQTEKASVLSIDLPKTTASLRSIPICSQLLRLLLPHYPCKRTGYVLTNQEQFISPRTYAYRYKKLLDTGAIPYINYHALRHTFATRCIEAGVDVKSLSEILGHANTAITLNTYVHSTMEQKRAQLEKLTWVL